MEKDIGKIKKNDITDIVVRIDDFGGKPGLTIREFTTSDRYTGFTKSGTRISQEAFKEFKDIINSIDEKEFAAIPVIEKPKPAAKPESTKAVAKEKKPKESKKKIEDIPDEDLL
jgi:hypothetical protein